VPSFSPPRLAAARAAFVRSLIRARSFSARLASPNGQLHRHSRTGVTLKRQENPQLESTIAVVGLVGATNAAEPTSLANASIRCTWRAARLNGVFFGIGAIREEAQPAGDLNARSVQCGSTDGVLSAL
jgi:hypothetical protein